jgi:3-oxoacyl-(acyl-carrier-protein) synthase
MRMALDGLEPDAVDAIVMHAPGTIQGDAYEMQAIAQVFPQMRPLCTSNKWKIGHTLGASGMLSLHLAVLMLQRQQFIPVPYLAVPQSRPALRKVLVNAVGFGGSAVSILLSR